MNEQDPSCAPTLEDEQPRQPGPPAELLATLSHELRSPLAVITTAVSTLLRYPRRLSLEERRLFLQSIQEASAQLGRAVERFLELAELEMGLLRLECAPVDPVSVAREALLAAEEAAARQRPGAFRFALELRDGAGRAAHAVPAVLADQRRLREILDHLLENALLFSPNGGRISLRLRPISGAQLAVAGALKSRQQEALLPPAPPTTFVEMRVSDEGQGIPTEQLTRVFERFYRVDTSLTRTANGLGLGLTICKYLVELQGGHIWATRRPRGGSALHVALPCSSYGNEANGSPLSQTDHSRRRPPLHAKKNNHSERR
jgi:signal transduction histidine kinase